jgi:hypothetical protein
MNPLDKIRENIRKSHQDKAYGYLGQPKSNHHDWKIYKMEIHSAVSSI